jgi:hypothetical protein
VWRQWLDSRWIYMAVGYTGKGKAIPVQAWRGPEGSRRLKVPGFKTIGTWKWWGGTLER